MNKRIMTGMAMTASAFALANGQPAAAQQEQCAPIYDETTEIGNSPVLEKAIGAYTAHGIGVHVQILKDSGKIGITNDSEAAKYLAGLVNSCDWPDVSAVSVFISDKPHVYDIHKIGKIEDDINDSSKLDDAEQDLIDDLRDPETPHQTDVANLLNELNPYLHPKPEATAKGGSGGGGGPDIPFIPILFGLVGLAAAGAGAGRTIRGLSLRTTYKGAAASADEVYTKLAETASSADGELEYLPKDDAPKLRAMSEQGEQGMVALSDSSTVLKRVYKGEARRIWPSKDKLQDNVELLEDVKERANHAAQELSAELTEFETQRNTLDETAKEFEAELAKLQTAIDDLNRNGWDVVDFTGNMQEFQSKQVTIAGLREKFYIDRPADMLEAELAEAKKLSLFLLALPGRRTAADEAIVKQPKQIEEANHTVNQSSAILNGLRAKYHVSCVEDLSTVDEQLSQTAIALQTYNDQASPLASVKSLKAVDQCEVLQACFNDSNIAIERLAGNVDARVSQLETIIKNLPQTFSAIDGLLTKAQSYAFDEFPADVEDKTRDKITVLKAAAGQLNIMSEADKPLYLQIDTQAQKLSTDIGAAITQARAEKNEMDGMRTNIRQQESQLRADLLELHSYVSMHRSDIGGRVSFSDNVPSPDTSGSRAQLRSRSQNFASLISSVESAKSEARRAVAAAEAERRRQEQEAAAAAAALAASQQSSYSSSSSFDSGSSWGGGSDSGGSFGGGSDSGGSW